MSVPGRKLPVSLWRGHCGGAHSNRTSAQDKPLPNLALDLGVYYCAPAILDIGLSCAYGTSVATPLPHAFWKLCSVRRWSVGLSQDRLQPYQPYRIVPKQRDVTLSYLFAFLTACLATAGFPLGERPRLCSRSTWVYSMEIKVCAASIASSRHQNS
jgi:hypothetical protein